MHCWIHALLHWRNTVLDLVVLGVSMGLLNFEVYRCPKCCPLLLWHLDNFQCDSNFCEEGRYHCCVSLIVGSGCRPNSPCRRAQASSGELDHGAGEVRRAPQASSGELVMAQARAVHRRARDAGKPRSNAGEVNEIHWRARAWLATTCRQSTPRVSL